ALRGAPPGQDLRSGSYMAANRSGTNQDQLKSKCPRFQGNPEQAEFAAGSMLPKAMAACDFAEATGNPAAFGAHGHHMCRMACRSVAIGAVVLAGTRICQSHCCLLVSGVMRGWTRRLRMPAVARGRWRWYGGRCLLRPVTGPWAVAPDAVAGVE